MLLFLLLLLLSLLLYFPPITTNCVIITVYRADKFNLPIMGLSGVMLLHYWERNYFIILFLLCFYQNKVNLPENSFVLFYIVYSQYTSETFETFVINYNPVFDIFFLCKNNINDPDCEISLKNSQMLIIIINYVLYELCSIYETFSGRRRLYGTL